VMTWREESALSLEEEVAGEQLVKSLRLIC
jgi:hypothetical protein